MAFDRGGRHQFTRPLLNCRRSIYNLICRKPNTKSTSIFPAAGGKPLLTGPFKFDNLASVRFVVRRMKPAVNFAVVLVTAPDLKTARALARAALAARLIACANLIPKIESHYWWEGKIESGAEILLVLKTAKSKLAALEKLIVARHPYDTPEILAVPLSAGNKKYLDWLANF
jgi:periplasmic divalent cation tolerance protein